MGIVLKNLDCLDLLRSLPDGSVDLMLTDPPYGVTQNEWDKPINLAELWLEWERVVKPAGAFVFTAQQPFATDLILTRRGFFKYDLIWHKSRPSGFLNASKMPLRNHEHILVFYRMLPTFNPQKTKGKPNHVANGKMSKKTANNNYGDFNQIMQIATDDKNPVSVVYFEQQDPNDILHPTQKPIDLFRYLIRTYTNPGETVFDGYSGSGTTAEACIKENRNFIGSELNKEYYDKSMERISIALSKPELFT